MQYLLWIAEEVREIMAELGLPLDGRDGRAAPSSWTWSRRRATGRPRASTSRDPAPARRAPRHPQHETQDWPATSRTSSTRAPALAEPALERGEPVEIDLPIQNTDRTVGTILGSEISRKYGEEGLPDDTIRMRFTGSRARAWAPSAPGA